MTHSLLPNEPKRLLTHQIDDVLTSGQDTKTPPNRIISDLIQYNRINTGLNKPSLWQNLETLSFRTL